MAERVQWELAWDAKHRRWYYQDRFSGESSWGTPEGCTLKLPTQPPKISQTAKEALPAGWEEAFDMTYNREYYFNRATKERTWTRPRSKPSSKPTASSGRSRDTRDLGNQNPALAAFDVPRGVSVDDAVISGSRRGLLDVPSSRRVAGSPRSPARTGASGRGALTWDSVDFSRRLQDAKDQMARSRSSDMSGVKKVLAEVANHNYEIRFQFGRVPRTTMVPYQRCTSAQVPTRGKEAQVTVSEMSTADAIQHFALRRRNVCALNFANGVTPGGGYKNGAVAQEEDLCRRFPQLYSSLFEAKKEGIYPFGPPTFVSAGNPGKYSDVLYTPELKLIRASDAHGFALVSSSEQVTASFVAAAAPNTNNNEEYDLALMFNTLEAVFKVPRMMQETDTLVCGAWGCGAFGCSPEDVSLLFAQAIQKFGHLYDEIHFAILKTPSNSNANVFRETLSRKGIKFTDIDVAA